MIDGLPSDTVSLDNAIFCMQGLKWPLMIDPQEQASKWLNKMHSKRRTLTKISNSNFISEMKASVKNGFPVLLTDVEDTLPAVLDSVFSKEIKMIDNMPMIKFG
jgi:dynein heavy chain